jgi:DNA-binding IclR family transcriptional regulator
MSNPVEGKTKGIAAIERALKVLDGFLAGDSPLTLAELTRRADLVKPTVLRALISLARAGYVVRLADGRYQLGAKVMRLSTTYQKGFRLEDHVLPVLRKLAEATGESASFYIREGGKRLCLFRVDSPQSVRDVVRAGDLMPIDQTSTGQVFTTFSEQGSRADTRYFIFASSGIVDTQTASLSTPVFGAEGQLFGALTLSGPTNRFGAVETTRMTQQLYESAGYLMRVLGGTEHVGLPQVARQSGAA